MRLNGGSDPANPQTADGTIRISKEALFEDTISPLVYGDFIEFLNDLIPGMWAEKIQDRSFEGVLQPCLTWPPGENWVYPRWKPFMSGQPAFNGWPDAHQDFDMVSATVSFDLDTENPLSGYQCARVRVGQGDEKPFIAGIIQEGIEVREGQKLNVEIYLRGEGIDEIPVKVLLGRSYGVFFRAYDQMEFQGVTDRWQKFTGSMLSSVSDDSASFAIGLSQEGPLWIDKVSLMPEDNRLGWRSDVVEAIRAMKPGVIRFGGSSLIYYQWETGIGPRERRAAFENVPWGNREENDVGLHEFLEFCELVGAEPLVCLNSNSTTIDQILNEIEYCNGPADARYGGIRAEMGHPAPFHVKYWQIGNEQSGEEYERRMVEYARAIRCRYPHLTLLASYPSENILSNLSDEVDYVCPHFYSPYSGERESEMRQLIEQIGRNAKNKDLKLGITEWNHTAGHWGWGRAWLLTLYNALNAARMFHMFHRMGDMIKIANRSNMTNSCCSGVIQTNRSGIYLTPCYYVQQGYANRAGDRVLKVEAEEDEVLDLSATRRQENGEIALFVVNYLGNAQNRTIDLSELSLSRKEAEVWSLSGPSLEAANSFQEKKRVAPQESIVEFQGDHLEYCFPAYSVTILRFE